MNSSFCSLILQRFLTKTRGEGTIPRSSTKGKTNKSTASSSIPYHKPEKKSNLKMSFAALQPILHLYVYKNALLYTASETNISGI